MTTYSYNKRPGRFWLSAFNSRNDKEYTVQCSKCGKLLTVNAYYQRSVPQKFRKLGWCIRNGAWHCPGCCRPQKDYKE